MTAVRMYPQLTLDGAREVAEAALARAREISMKAITVAVVDSGGHPLLVLRQKASYPTVDIAIAKARTSACFGIKSGQLAEQMKAGNPMNQADLATLGHLTAMAGGEPLLADGRSVGGIGVSGGNEEEDVSCAAAGAASLGIAETGLM